MYRFERPRDFDRRHIDKGGISGASRVRAAVLLPLLVAYGLGFVVISPLAQESAARSAAEGNDPMAFVGP
jgi:aryl-alcohol dehydrogenase-like predicted oxidoreductase